MAIERVVAGVDLAALKPAIERGVVIVQDALRGFIPGDIFRQFTPERYKIAIGRFIDGIKTIIHGSTYALWYGILSGCMMTV